MHVRTEQGRDVSQRNLLRSRVALFVVLGLLAAPVLQADPFVMKNTDVVSLPRAANGRDYLLYIAVPESYAASPARSYPVIYACDGYWDFPLLLMNHGNCVTDGAMPECIIVGIGYAGANPDVGALRQLDLTPGVDPGVDPTGTTSGRALDFLNVIVGQIVPYVESHFRVDTGFRVVTGSSYGGLFSLYAAFERPGFFQGVVAPSPAIWWRSEYVLGRIRTVAAAGTRVDTRIFASYATAEYTSIITTTQALARDVPGLNIPGVVLAVREIEGERHSSTKPEAYNRGLRFVFAERAPRPSGAFGAGFNSRPSFVNLSTRGRVAPGESALIGGFVVTGLMPKPVLVRAIGPTLSRLGVTAPLANPRLTVFDGTQRAVAVSDDWGTAANFLDVAVVSSQVGAFMLSASSRDAATIVTLAPGAYTVVVESVDGGSGIALVEAYEIPQ